MAEDYTKPDVNHFKLSFRIHKVTSQDENFPVTELLISNGQNLGSKVSSLFLSDVELRVANKRMAKSTILYLSARTYSWVSMKCKY